MERVQEDPCLPAQRMLVGARWVATCQVASGAALPTLALAACLDITQVEFGPVITLLYARECPGKSEMCGKQLAMASKEDLFTESDWDHHEVAPATDGRVFLVQHATSEAERYYPAGKVLVNGWMLTS